LPDAYIVRDVGSYGYNSFQSPDVELKRLIRQAEVGLSLERPIWTGAGLKPGMRVLDLGCGPGIVSSAMAEMVSDGFVHGIDASPELLNQARKIQALRNTQNLRFSEASIYELPSELCDYDFAYARFLYQHLQEPGKASEQIIQTLTPGGTVCIVDIDDAWLMLQPEPKGFQDFLSLAERGQEKRGGDRRVGRRLAAYLSEAGFEDVQTRVQVVTSHDLGMDAFLNITTGFKHEQVPEADKSTAMNALEEINKLKNTPGAWGAVGVFVCTGRKPIVSENDDVDQGQAKENVKNVH
jgi:ubiquinone/menaquinone biosynthesis C-methylase UbiE